MYGDKVRRLVALIQSSFGWQEQTCAHGGNCSTSAHSHCVAILEAERLKHEAQGGEQSRADEPQWSSNPPNLLGQSDACFTTGCWYAKTRPCLQHRQNSPRLLHMPLTMRMLCDNMQAKIYKTSKEQKLLQRGPASQEGGILMRQLQAGGLVKLWWEDVGEYCDYLQAMNHC